MRILVYGAGVQGCELAHRLLQNKKNVVTMLARGEWKERLDQRGLVIRHWAQCRTTVDRVATIDTLAPDDCYDLVFVTMQAGQLPDVLPILKQNRSEYFVFVGNDPHAVEVMQAMQRPADKIAFGFQSSGGHRDVDKVVSAHVGVGMTIGGATAPLSGVFRYRVKTAFEGAKYKLTFVSDMDGWLKCHLALILPATSPWTTRRTPTATVPVPPAAGRWTPWCWRSARPRWAVSASLTTRCTLWPRCSTSMRLSRVCAPGRASR